MIVDIGFYSKPGLIDVMRFRGFTVEKSIIDLDAELFERLNEI